MKVKILSVKAKPFKNNDGDMMDYFWYTALRLADDVQIQFGSQVEGYEGEKDLPIVKLERANNKFGYKDESKVFS